jgi:hypothetical protein
MPSVQLTRLRQQAVELAEFFPQPEVFARRLDLLLESYSVKASRKGEIKGGQQAVLPSYRAPSQVLNQVLLECRPLVADEPELALAVCDELWQRRMLEPRQLAARLLGQTPVSNTDEISRRILDWNEKNREPALAEAIAVEATEWLREEQPYALIAFFSACLDEKGWRPRALGLLALTALLAETEFPDLPAVHKALEQRMDVIEKRLRPYWLDVYLALLKRAPQETLYLLQQRLKASEDESLRWVARQLLDHVGAEDQAALRAAL